MERLDLHLHHIPPFFLDWLRTNAIRAEAEFLSSPGGERLLMNGKWPVPLTPAFTRPEALLSDLEAGGFSGGLVSPAPQLFCWGAGTTLALEAAQAMNEALASTVAGDPRLRALAMLPMVDPAAAAAELARAIDHLGLLGAIVGTEAGELDLTDPALIPFWEAADQRQAILLLHPWIMAGRRMEKYHLANLIGNPVATATCAADLILSGLLDRYPRVRLILAHGGGYLPYQIGRLDSGHRRRPEVRIHNDRPPSSYLRRFYYDTCLFEAKAVRFLVDLAGADRVVHGSDYPFPLASWPHQGMWELLSDADRAGIDRASRDLWQSAPSGPRSGQ